MDNIYRYVFFSRQKGFRRFGFRYSPLSVQFALKQSGSRDLEGEI